MKLTAKTFRNLHSESKADAAIKLKNRLTKFKSLVIDCQVAGTLLNTNTIADIAKRAGVSVTSDRTGITRILSAFFTKVKFYPETKERYAEFSFGPELDYNKLIEWM